MKYTFFPYIFSIHLLLISCVNAKSNKQTNIQNDDTTLSGNDNVTVSEEYNANTRTNKYIGYFLYGSNMGWRNSNWTDEDIADILVGNAEKNIAGVGVNSLRPALYEDFVERFGYDVRISAFEYYLKLGAKNNVAFIGDQPLEDHREKTQYGPGTPSQSYINLYESIWDDGENGTPVNENNYYAAYVYNVVKRYKKYVKFWEIKNEPDFTYELCGDYPSGKGCNWWDNDPSPAILTNWHAPIQSYVRMLRVSYEVIKYVDPDAFVCLGGVGYLSFVDAILRNTDNPDGGKVTDKYPYKGGAWFDCLSYHIYPMYRLHRRVNLTSKYYRHSDEAVQVVVNQNNMFIDLMKKYGYNGAQYPTKAIIITETNVPNKQTGDFIGSESSQRNYLTKVCIVAQRNNISGIYPYCPWDFKEQNENGKEYDYKGFYKLISETPGAEPLRMHESGVAWRTMSRLLSNRKYDERETAKLALSEGMDGGAFFSTETNDYIYVLWAKTTKDMDETASADYTFPAAINVKKMVVIRWDDTETEINGNTIRLTGDPVFIKANATVTTPIPVAGVSLNRSSESIELNKTLQLVAKVAPENAKNKNVTWSSSNSAVATVDNLGQVIPASVGIATVTVKTDDGSKTASCEITVKPTRIPVSYILLNPSYHNMSIGGSSQLVVTFSPENTTNQKIIWSSSDEKIASVDKTGKVTAHAAGKILITATPEDDESKSKDCILHVTGR